MEEAVNTLFELSADEKKRLEYEVREKAIRDHNWKMYNARQSGLEEGIELATQIFKAKSKGKSVEEIAEEYHLSVERVNTILEKFL